VLDVPAKLRPAVGRARLKQSLGTEDILMARKWRDVVIGAWQRRLTAVAAGRASGPPEHVDVQAVGAVALSPLIEKTAGRRAKLLAARDDEEREVLLGSGLIDRARR